MSPPLISVIIPAYNCEKFISGTLQIVLNQTHTNFEVLIADDASTDNTKTIIDSFTDPRIKTFHNKKNLGYLKTCNLLFKQVKGDYIVFQDADDLSDLTRFEKQLKVFGSDAEIGVCGCGVSRIDLNNIKYETISFPSDINTSLKERKFEFVAGTFFLKKEVYDKVGGYNKYFDRIGFEHFYWAILIADHYKLVNIPDTLYFYRFNPESYSNAITSKITSFSYQSLLYLLEQRLTGRKDYLETGHPKLLKSEVYLKLCSISLNEKNPYSAFKNCCRSILFNPFSFYKIRTLFHILKKLISG